MNSSSQSRRLSRLRAKVLLSTAIATCVGALGLSSVAGAAPTGEYAPFADCPLTQPNVVTCLYSLNNGGTFTIGKKTVPLKNPVTLQGGLAQDPETFAVSFVGAADGNTLSKSPQPVPGGLLGIEAPSWWPSFLREYFNQVVINEGLSGVTATVELARPASEIKIDLIKLIEQNGVALALPVKVKLSNAFLGSSCYIGSSTNPIRLNFTTGTTSPPPPNVPISGSVGTPSVNEAGTILTLAGGRLVDNSFSSPGANGCGGLFSFLVDPFVDSILGTPSPAGKNTAILEGKIQGAEAAAVKASE